MPAAPIDKVIVTNLARLAEKYKASGVTAIRTAIKNLIVADAKRGLKTVLVDLSNKPAMKKYKASTVAAADAADPRVNKDAIDQVFTSVNPSYLMLLGAPDVIPHQDLKNPVFPIRTRTSSRSATSRTLATRRTRLASTSSSRRRESSAGFRT